MTWNLHIVGHEAEETVQKLVTEFVDLVENFGHVLESAVLTTDKGVSSLSVTKPEPAPAAPEPTPSEPTAPSTASPTPPADPSPAEPAPPSEPPVAPVEETPPTPEPAPSTEPDPPTETAPADTGTTSVAAVITDLTGGSTVTVDTPPEPLAPVDLPA